MAKTSSLAEVTFKRKPHKMVKHTQTIRRLLHTNCLSVFDHFVELALKELTASLITQQNLRQFHSYWRLSCRF